MPTPEQLVALVEHALKGSLGPLLGRLGTLEARLEALESRPAEPGPPGPPGPAGLDGAPGLKYAGLWIEGQCYTPGEIVTHGGSAWHCDVETTARPGGPGDGWQLMVKRGRDGRDVRREG
jgi:hypothetical protein